MIQTFSVPTYVVTILIGMSSNGALELARSVCRDYTEENGLDVTLISAELFLSGSAQIGAWIGLASTPRTPGDDTYLMRKALVLADRLMVALERPHVTVTCPDRTYLISQRS